MSPECSAVRIYAKNEFCGKIDNQLFVGG